RRPTSLRPPTAIAPPSTAPCEPRQRSHIPTIELLPSAEVRKPCSRSSSTEQGTRSRPDRRTDARNVQRGTARNRLESMKPALRDLFAMHFAAALAHEQRYTLEFIAGRAYDLADAMLVERERRIDAEACAAELGDWVSGDRTGGAGALLDEPAPPSDRD